MRRRPDIHTKAGELCESWSWFCGSSLHRHYLRLHEHGACAPPSGALCSGQPVIHARCACASCPPYSTCNHTFTTCTSHPPIHTTTASQATSIIMNGHANGNGASFSSSSSTTSAGAVGTFRVKAGLAQMLKGGVIMGTSGVLVVGGGRERRGMGESSVMHLCVYLRLSLVHVLACR